MEFALEAQFVKIAVPSDFPSQMANAALILCPNQHAQSRPDVS